MKADFKVAISVPFAAAPKRGKPRAKPADPSVSRRPRIAVLMALAIHMEQLLRGGVVKNQAELAKLAGVSRARLTQVMNLLGLAPDIQDALLFHDSAHLLPPQAIERSLRSSTAVMNWNEQRRTIMSRRG